MAKPRKRGNSYQLRATSEGITYTDSWKIPDGLTAKQAEKQAQKEQDKFAELIQKGINPGRITFSEAAERYINYITDSLKPTTVQCHQDRLKKINQSIGHIKIKNLKKQHIRGFIAELEKPYTTKSGIVKTRSAVTIADYFKTISSVLTFACEEDWLEENICIGKGIRKPIQTTAEEKVIPPDVIQQYMKALETATLQDRLFFHLTLNTGCRKGEILGLAWSNIDLDNNTIYIVDNSQYLPGQGIIFQSTKRKASDRLLEIPPYVTEMLRQMKAQQAENRLKAGKLWMTNPSNPQEKYCENHASCSNPCQGFCSANCSLFKESDRVFCDTLGRPTHPDSPRKSIQKLGKRAGLPKITIHQLRHTAASLLIKGGNAVTDVAAYLGHSSPRITMSVYAHAINERDHARRMDNSISNILRIAK